MNTFHILVIRACKSRKPTVRLQSLFKRYYLKDGVSYSNIFYVLSGICDEYKLYKGVQQYAVEFHSTFTTYGKNCDNLSRQDIQEMEVNTVISKIRHSSIVKFPGFIVPAKFRH